MEYAKGGLDVGIRDTIMVFQKEHHDAEHKLLGGIRVGGSEGKQCRVIKEDAKYLELE